MNGVMWVQDGLLLGQTLVLAWTAYLIKRYTDETSGLRKEMVRQNKLSLRPYVVPVFKRENNKPTLWLKNIGHGCAVNIAVSPRKIASMAGGSFEVRLKTPDYLASGDTSETEASYWVGDTPHTLPPRAADGPEAAILENALRPGTAGQRGNASVRLRLFSVRE